MISNDVLIICLIVLVLLSSMFSSIETAYSSLNKVRIKFLANENNLKAIKVLDILDNFDNFLSTILIGNNIVNIIATIIATIILNRIFSDNGPLISTIVVTLVVLIFGEITPKSIAKKIPETIAISTVDSVRFLMFILMPLTVFFNLIRKFIESFINIKEDDLDITDELMTMVEEAENEGDLQEHESDLITAAIEFNDLDAGDILTPRVNIIAIDINMSFEEIEKIFRTNPYSRLPVYENSIDNIIGIMHEKDFYSLIYQKNYDIKSILKSVIYTNEHIKISNLLKQLQSKKVHMSVVIDEYGGTLGIITMEDILEELVGEIWDEHDTIKEIYKKVADNVYIVDGDVEVEDLFDHFNIEIDENDDEYITVSGWVNRQFENIPQVNDSFIYNDLKVVVTKANEKKVLEVEITVLKNNLENNV